MITYNKSAWLLLQIGEYKLPRINVSCEIDYELVDAITEMANAPSFDHHKNRRAPFKEGKVKFSGVYQDCPQDVPEWSGIKKYKGVYVPFLFAQIPETYDEYGTGPRGTLYANCSVYAWAWGKVGSAPSSFSTDDFAYDRGTGEVTLDARLRTAMSEATWENWRYGFPLFEPLNNGTRTTTELETEMAEDKDIWYLPCNIPEPCDWRRFYFRNINPDFNPTAQCDVAKWPSTRRLAGAGASEKVMVGGNYWPRVRALLTGNNTLTVKNRLGTTTYSYTGSTVQDYVFSDSERSIVAGFGSDNKFKLFPTAPAPIQLEPGENILTITKGAVDLSIVPQWIE